VTSEIGVHTKFAGIHCMPNNFKIKFLFFCALPILFLISPCLVKAEVNANPSYSKNVFALGYGFYSFDFDNWGGSKGPLMLKYEKRFENHIGIGTNLAFGRKSSNILGASEQKTTFFSVLLRANYYFEINSQLETYAGVGIGLRNTIPFHKPTNKPYNGKNDGLTIPDNLLGLEATIGLRYHLAKKVSFYTEAGFSKGLIQFGACYHW